MEQDAHLFPLPGPDYKASKRPILSGLKLGRQPIDLHGVLFTGGKEEEKGQSQKDRNPLFHGIYSSYCFSPARYLEGDRPN